MPRQYRKLRTARTVIVLNNIGPFATGHPTKQVRLMSHSMNRMQGATATADEVVAAMDRDGYCVRPARYRRRALGYRR